MTDVAEKPNFITSSLDFLVNWGRTNSLWPFPYGTACCAIEFMSTEVGRYDLSRIGSEYVRFTPRQSDVLLVAGTITYKQAPILKRIYEQMAEPRWVIAMGACACSGGFYDSYCTVPVSTTSFRWMFISVAAPAVRRPSSTPCSTCRKRSRTSLT